MQPRSVIRRSFPFKFSRVYNSGDHPSTRVAAHTLVDEKFKSHMFGFFCMVTASLTRAFIVYSLGKKLSSKFVALVLRRDHVVHLFHNLTKRVRLVESLVVQPAQLVPLIPTLVLFSIKVVEQLLEALLRNRRQHIGPISVHPTSTF